MPAPRYLPSEKILGDMAERMTHQQIADQVYRDTGYRVSRSSVSVALSRVAMTKPKRRHTIPWRVKSEHNNRYPIVMLRLLARRQDGEQLTTEQATRLNSWLARCDRDSVIVAYAPSTEEGTFYVPRKSETGYVREEVIS